MIGAYSPSSLQTWESQAQKQAERISRFSLYRFTWYLETS